MKMIPPYLLKGDLSETTLKNIYKLSVFLRFLFVFVGVSYLHPDQFFQSSEVVAGDVFGFDIERPWEFEKEHACRTIFTPAIIVGLPYYLLKTISVAVNLVNGFTLFYLPRLFLFALSFIVDYICWDLGGKESTALVTLGTSWVTIVFLLCPFSNTTETLLLAIALYLALHNKTKTWMQYAMFGAVMGIGIFNRFTFALYVFPVLLYLVYEEFLEAKQSRNGWQALLSAIVIGFSATSAAIIAIDSAYFGRFVITPLNSLKYNANEDNLAEHGKHWRLTHSLINMPFLLGPLYIIALLPYYNWLDDRLGEQLGQAPKKTKAGKRKIPRSTDAAPKPKKVTGTAVDYGGRPKPVVQDIVLIGVIASGLTILSFAPHQEMRFLVPLLVPFVILGHKGLVGAESNRFLQAGWLTFNILMLVIMGISHQGGVVPSTLNFAKLPTTTEQGTPITNHLVYYHTYMPPRHLLAQPKPTPGAKPKFSVHDLKGSPIADLKKRILRIKEALSFASTDKIFIIAPTSEAADLESMVNDMTLKRHFWPNIDTETLSLSFESFAKNTTLNVYEWNH